MKKVVIISHDSFQAGAPILLLNLAALLIETGAYQISFIIKTDNGTLTPRFKALGPVLIWNKPQQPKQSYLKTRVEAIAKKALRKPVPAYPDGLPQFLEGTQLIISNTITNGDIMPAIRLLYTGKIISYVHELEMAGKFFTSPGNIAKMIAGSTAFAVPSVAVKKYLNTELQIPEQQIKVLNYYIPQLNRVADNKEACRKLLNIPQDSFVIGGVGTSDWRKGADIFVQLALQVKNAALNKPVSFYWFGANETIDLVRLQYEVKKMGLQNKVHFIPASNQVPYFFKAIDLFVLTSREDPYPLVVLEAADAAVPIICFEDAGGAPEFVAQDAGSTVPYLDMVAAASAIKSYILNPQLLAMQGSAAQKKVAGLHQDKQLIMQQFETISA